MGSKVQLFARRRNLPFYTFAEDVAASGGYWLLCSGTHGVYADRNSMVGSIGVVSMLTNWRRAWDARLAIGLPVIQTSPNLLLNRYDPLKEEGITARDEEAVKEIQTKIFVDFREWVE